MGGFLHLGIQCLQFIQFGVLLLGVLGADLLYDKFLIFHITVSPCF